MTDAVIVSAVRTAVGKAPKGTLRATRPDEMAATVIAEALSMADKVIAAMGGDVKGKTIGVLGLAFKQNTDDMRDAPSLDIIPALQAAGAKVRAYDPEAMDEAAHLLNDIEFAKNAYDAVQDADAMVIITEWDQFRALDFDRIKAALSTNIVVDLRNIYSPDDMAARGFKYTSIGRPSI